MKLTKYLHSVCVGLATVGLVLPNPSVLQGAEKQVTGKASATIIDVSLVDGGVLQGQVISAQGQALANAPVVIHQGKTELANTSTDKDGKFALQGLKGGVYVVSTKGAAGVVRAWTPRTAPPSSVQGVLLVPETATARAQDDGEGTNWGLGALIVGGIAGTIIAVAIDHNNAS